MSRKKKMLLCGLGAGVASWLRESDPNLKFTHQYFHCSNVNCGIRTTEILQCISQATVAVFISNSQVGFIQQWLLVQTKPSGQAT